MYLPRDFKEERVPVLHEAIRQAALGTLVTLGEAGLEASHVPMLIDPEPAQPVARGARKLANA